MNVIMEQSDGTKCLLLMFDNKEQKKIWMKRLNRFANLIKAQGGKELNFSKLFSSKANELSIPIYEDEIITFINLVLEGSVLNEIKEQEDYIKQTDMILKLMERSENNELS